MKSPRLLRSPFLWILAAFLLIMLGMNLFSASSRYQQVPTSKIISVIEGSDPLREVVLVDGDQEIRLEYKEDGGARRRAPRRARSTSGASRTPTAASCRCS